MSILTNIKDQVTSYIISAVPRLSNKIIEKQTVDNMTRAGEEFVRLSFEGGNTEFVATGTSNKTTILNINYYRVKGGRQNNKTTSEIKEAILKTIPYCNRPYWWYINLIQDFDSVDVEGDDLEGFQLTYEFYTALATVCKE